MNSIVCNYKWIWPYINAKKWRFSLALFLMVLEVLLDIMGTGVQKLALNF